MWLPVRRRGLCSIHEGGAGLSQDPLLGEHLSFLCCFRFLVVSMVLSGLVVAEVCVDVPEGVSGLIGESLSPEVERPTSERSSVSMSVVGGRVVLSVVASDVVALRAALNSYLRWVGAILDVVDAVG